jgi:hypothetical protein
MQMSAYSEATMKLAEDFINTYDTLLPEPEHLQTLADLRRFLIDHEIPTRGLKDESLEEAKALRTQLREMWTDDNPDRIARGLNALLNGKPLSATFTPIGRDGMELELGEGHDLPVLERLAAECALGIGYGTAQYGVERLRACSAEPCRDVFVDTSRNATRRFCSDRCANRYNTLAYRSRTRR